MEKKGINNLPQEYKTVWSFKKTDQLPINYKGRCLPEIPRYCLKRFTKKNDIVLDGFMGSGTALMESIKMGRQVISIDPSDEAIQKTKERLKKYLSKNSLNKWIDKNTEKKNPNYLLIKGDSRNLLIKDEKVDFIFGHIPYWCVITYTKPEEKNVNDISRIWNLTAFNQELLKIFKEFYRTLKFEKYCAILVGDIRQGGRKIPLAHICLSLLLKSGFYFFDQIIKISENAISMRRPKLINDAIEKNRSITIHEYIVIVKKSKNKYNDIGLNFL